MRFSRLSVLAIPLLALSFSGVAFAQTPPAPPAPAADPAHPQAPRVKMSDRFAQANTTNDGHLTLDQARAGMPMVARHFAAIDKDNKGYVTLADIHVYLKEQRAARHQTPPSTSG